MLSHPLTSVCCGYATRAEEKDEVGVIAHSRGGNGISVSCLRGRVLLLLDSWG